MNGDQHEFGTVGRKMVDDDVVGGMNLSSGDASNAKEGERKHLAEAGTIALEGAFPRLLHDRRRRSSRGRQVGLVVVECFE